MPRARAKNSVKKNKTETVSDTAPVASEQPAKDLLADYLDSQHSRSERARLWLWLGVGGLAVIIVALWGWSLTMRLSSYNWQKSSETGLLQQIGDNWNILFNNAGQKQTTETIKRQLRDIVTQINQADSASTTTANLVTPTTTTP